MKKKYFSSKILLLIIILGYSKSYSQIKNSFDIRYQTTVRGDLTIISNNIVNKTPTNVAYNLVGNASEYNDQVDMQFIDIDGDPTTFNSSSAVLNLPDPECSRVVHAGLYWSATYRYTVGNNPSSGRNEDWDHVKFKVPGGNYIDITPTSPVYNTQVLYNGFADTNQTNVGHGPYSCFADVTSIIAPLTNPNGNYFVGNIRVSRDGRSNQGNFAIPGGVAGGWTLVIVYENINLPGKKITTFDGHAVIAAGVGNMDIPVSGFITLPPPLPVRAKMAVSCLEGDNRIFGDQLLIKANGVANYTNLFNTPPPTAPVLNNFFNSSITVNGTNFLARNPNSLNTLGWDSHLIRINNPLNTVIPNDETGVTLRATSTQDKYDIFFTSFDVEIIEPKIPLIKTVEDFSGNNIDGDPLSLGQEFFYSLCFENTGNDNAQNFVITDQLPTNIIFPVDGTITVGDDLILPHGVSYSFNPTTNQLTFTVNNDLVEENDPQYCIKIKVRTPVDCFDVIDACANIVTNQAFVSYQGEENTQVITDNPSYNGFDECTYPTPGATNFLTNIDLCSFVREEVLCGNSIVLTAANGYSNYVWTYDHDNNVATPPIPVPGGNTQSITVSNIGTYYVSMVTPAPCISLNETINVIYFNDLANVTNPVTPFADVVAICPNDGSELPKIILCGLTDSQLIQTGITSAVNIVWQQLVVGSCPGVTITDCANTNSSCLWNQVGTGPDFLATNAGQYRIIIFYQNGCFRTFYFNVYKNVLNPTISSTDIVCNTEGTITVSSIPLGYEYSLSPTGPWQTSNTFSNITTAGSYTVYIRQTGVTNGCVFEFPFIDVVEKILDVDVITTNQLCNNGFGSIRVQVNGVNPQYYYQLFQGATLLNSVGPTSTNNYLFSNLNPGTYTVTATTDDGCTYTENVVIQNLSNLTFNATVSQHISCTQGNIQVNPNGGQPPYNYAIYSYNGVLVNPTNYQFQTSVIFDVQIGGQGDYQFIVVDSNNCTSLSNIVTINLEPPVNTSEVHTNVTCNGLNNGTITVSAAPTNGYTVTYSIDGTTFQSSNTFNNLAPGNYTITVKYKKGNRECFYTINVVITEPQPLIGQSQLVQQKTCIVNGTIQAINVTGGTAPYSYSINGTTFQSSNIFSNLNAGSYTIIIKDANNCLYQTLPIEITPAIAPTDLITSSTAITCPTLTSNITATVVGGTAPYSFQIITPSVVNPTSTVGTTATFNNLVAGTYTVKVTDSKGCVYQESITIQAIDIITVNGNTVSNVQCYGTATGSVLFTVANFNSSYSYTLNGGTPIINQTTTTISFNNLVAGTYTIVVTDTQTNCQATKVVTVTQPASALQLSAPFTPKTCIANGSLNATATGGWGSYQFTLTQPNGALVGPQTNGVFGNLSQTGTYIISVEDANNCVVSSTFTINATTNPDLTLSPLSNLCINSTSGASLIVTTTGGTPGYQYQINGGTLQNSGTFTNLAAGTYTIKVIDSYGCEDTITQVINPQLTAQATLTKALDCTTNPQAIINVAINGGQSPYQYQIKFNGGAWGALSNVSGSSISYTTANPGSYQFQITDAQGCVFQTNTITINPISNPSILSITPVSPLCNGNNNGTLTVNIDASFGSGPFQYNINGGTYQSSNVFTNLIAGSYTIGVKDSKDCIDSETIVLTQPQPLIGQSQLVQPITCLITTGTIEAIGVSGGTSPYTYSINGVSFVSNPVFSGLNAGTYVIRIKDLNGCIISTNPITLSVPLPPTDITLTSSAITCPNLTTNIVATAIGGTAPYTYQIISPSIINPTTITGNTVSFNNLPVSGNTVFTIKVTDANGCEYQKNIPVQAVSLISVNGLVNNNVACLNDANGQVTFTVSGFSTNYSYSINSGTVVTNQTNSQIILTNLVAGTYSILVTDLITNCTATNTVTVLSPSSPLTLNAPFTQPTCNIGGSVNANAAGGWGSYQYTLTYPSGTTVNQSSGLFSNLIQNGIYIIKVTDANGCEISQSFTLTPYINPSIVVDLSNSDLCYDTTNGASIEVIASGGTPAYQYQIQLNGGSYSSLQNNSVFSNLTPGNYTIQVVDNFGCTATVNQVIVSQLLANATLTKNLDCSTSPNALININITGGTTPYQYQVNVNNTGFGVLTNVVSNPFNYTVLTAGTYQFSITDSAGCSFITNTIQVNPISNPSITALTQTTPVLCNGNNNATITTTINSSSGIGPFEYSIDGINFQPSPTFSGLSAGNYTVTVRDSNLCTDTEVITINQPNAINFNITKTDIICTGSGTQYGQINVENVLGGTQPYTYYLSNNFGLIDQYTTTNNENHTFIVLNFGIYTVEVIDANGCSLINNNIIIASPPDDLDIDVSTATVNCVSGGTAIITVSSPVASGSYAFAILTQNTPPVYPGPEWIPADIGTPQTATFNGLIPGVTYTFIVLDLVTNCYYFETANAPIITPSSITSTIDVVQNVSCTGSGNGSVSFSMTNFDPSTTSVSYQIFNAQSNTPTSPSFSGSLIVDQPVEVVTNFASLPPGIYYILITENDGINVGCTSTTTNFQITQSTNLLAVTATSTNDNCNTNAGIVNAIGQYGTPSYSFIIRDAALAAPIASDPTWSSISTFNVESGNYIVYIKDANNCIQQTPINVGLDSYPEITSVVVDNPCANEGLFEVIVTRDTTLNIGIAPYTYQVDGGVSFIENASTFTISNLFSGNHSIRITDANGCFFDFPFTINQNLSGNTSIIDQPTCIPPNSGSIQVNAANGTGVYSFTINSSPPVTISNGTATATFTGLNYGNYIITINDGNCSIPLSIQLEQPNPVDFTIIKQDPSCNGDTNGVIEVLLNPLNDNNPPYTYTLSAPGFTTITQTNGLFNIGLGENNYTVKVESSRGCELTLPIILSDPDPLVANDPNSYLFTCTNAGVININGLTVTGGDSNYFYSLDNINFQPLTNPSNIIITDTGAQQPVTVYIKDGKDCTTSFSYLFETKQTISNPSILINTSLSCNDDEEITISFTGNPTGNYSYQQLPSGTVTPFTGTSFTPPPINTTGQYTYEIIDISTGCNLLTTHNVLPYPVANITAQPTQGVDCFGNNNGQLSFTIQNYTGSYDYEVFTSPGNISVLAGTSSLPTFTSTSTLVAGNYYVEIKENAYPFCSLTSPVITIDSPAQPLSLQLIATNDRDCLSNIGTILASTSGGTSPYQYQLSNSSGIIQSFSSDNYFENLADGTYTVSVTDAKGCQISDTILIGLDPTPEINLALLNPCAAEGQFEIEVSRITNGIAPYNYTIDGNAPITQNTTPFIVSNLLSGSHTITIFDANGCGETKTLIILPVLSGTITNIIHPSCTNNDGVIDAQATNGSGNYTYILQNSSGITIDGPNTSGLFNTNLGYGDYNVVITDSNPAINCSVTLPVNLEQPTAVNYTLTTVQPTCNAINGGTANGSITVVLDASNNNPPYTYSINDGINPIITQNNGVFTGLAGSASGITYTITVESNRGCQKIETVVLQTPQQLIIPTISVGQFGCNSNNTANVITVTVPTPTGGTPPYLYSFDGINFSNQNTFDIIDNGTIQSITITVQDANSCFATQTLTNINPLIKVDASIAQNAPLTCASAETVEITIVGDPSHNYTYQLLPSTVAIPVTSNPFTTTLNQPGTYNYLIIDTTTNCSVITNDYIINPLPKFEVIANHLTDVTCYNVSDGSMNFTVSNFIGNFNYDVIDSSGTIILAGITSNTSNPTIVSGLAAGNYTINVSIPTSNSYQNCSEISNMITIGTPQELQLTIAQTSPVTCTDDKGTITVTSTIGGSGVYEYQLVSMPSGTIIIPYSSTSIFSDLAHGDYKVLVRDSNAIGCEASQLITLNQASFITANYTITNQNLSCYNDNNASVTITNVLGGQGSYQYTLTYPNGTVVGPQLSPTFTGLIAGIGYTLGVTDGWNCDVQLLPFTISQPQPIEASLVLERALTCDITPQVKITATGGTPPYFVNGQSFTTSIILNVTMPTTGNGVFQYTVTDSNSCAPVQTNEIVIEPIQPIVVELLSYTLNVNCANEDNAVVIVTNTTGGQGNYQYYLQNSTGSNIAGPNSTGVFNNIAGSIIPGETYYVLVTSGDCEQTSAAILVTEPFALTTPTVNIKNISCFGKKDGEISLALTGGVQPYQFAVSPNLSQTIDPSNPNNITITGLGAGTYDILYQDANGCYGTITRTITEPSALVFFQPTVVSPKCDGESGSVSLTVSGGTPPYQFSFDGENNYISNGTNTYTNNTTVFGDEEYEIYIKDANGCVTNAIIQTDPTVDLSSTYYINPGCPTALNPYANTLTVLIDDSLLSTTQFSLDNQTNYQSNNVFTNLTPGNHVVYIKNDNGCVKQTEVVTVTTTPILELSASETGLNQITAVATGGKEPYTFVFNGNNNGSNNVYIINKTGQQTITVIDDNGCEETILLPATFYDIIIPNYFTPDNGWTPENIDNFNDLVTKVFDRYGREVAFLRKGEKWYGNYRGNPLPTGDYWYIVEVNDGTGRTFVGNVTLYR